MSNSFRSSVAAATASLALMFNTSLAQADVLTDSVRVSGFGTLALTHGGSDDLGFRANISQKGIYDDWTLKTDSVLGVQFDADFNDRLSGTLQLVAKDRIHNGLEESVEWAYLSYAFNPAWELRVGRFAHDALALGEYRHVGFASSWVRPPVDYYGPILLTSFDGFDLTYSRPLSGGRLLTKVYWGFTDGSFESAGSQTEFDIDPIYGVSLRYLLDNLTLRTSYSRARIASFNNQQLLQLTGLLNSLPEITGGSELAERLSVGGLNADYYSVGAEYRNGPWSSSAELAYLDSNRELSRPFIGGYVSLARHIGDVTLFGLVSHARTLGDVGPVEAPLVPAPLSEAVQKALSGQDSEQKTLSLGARWDLRSNLALKAQWDRTWVEENQAFAWDTRSTEVAEQSVDTITLTMDFLF